MRKGGETMWPGSMDKNKTVTFEGLRDPERGAAPMGSTLFE